MKTLFAITLIILCLSGLLESILIKFGDLEFTVDDAMKLKNVIGEEKEFGHKMEGILNLCKEPTLPANFKPICQKNDAPQVFSTLYDIASNPYPCDICSFAACTGCT
uniref:Guanylate cyclase activator 2B n=1 Tax=Callorhinchus milii TaxID=7868 RepID=K4GBS9_CALMI|nr:guanylin-like protein [Callorhinchus milii]